MCLGSVSLTAWFMFCTSLLFLHHQIIPLRIFLLFLCAPFQLNSQNKLFLGIKILGRGHLAPRWTPKLRLYLKSYLVIAHCNIIVCCTTRSLTWSPSLTFPHQNPVCTYLPHSATCPAHIILHALITRTMKLSICIFLYSTLTSTPLTHILLHQHKG
jgi:hypothetical protein